MRLKPNAYRELRRSHRMSWLDQPFKHYLLSDWHTAAEWAYFFKVWNSRITSLLYVEGMELANHLVAVR